MMFFLQAWTAIPVFTGDYVYTEPFQLPLFHGHPTQGMLKQLAQEPCKEWLVRSARSGAVCQQNVLHTVL